MDKKETGYTKTPNWLFEELYQSEFNGSTIKVYLLIYRMTEGYHKQSDRLSISTIVDKTGVSKWSVIRALKVLQDGGWISVKKKKSHETFYETNAITLLRGSSKNATRGSSKNAPYSVAKMQQYQIKGKDKPLSDGCLPAPSSRVKDNISYEELNRLYGDE